MGCGRLNAARAIFLSSAYGAIVAVPEIGQHCDGEAVVRIVGVVRREAADHARMGNLPVSLELPHDETAERVIDRSAVVQPVLRQQARASLIGNLRALEHATLVEQQVPGRGQHSPRREGIVHVVLLRIDVAVTVQFVTAAALSDHELVVRELRVRHAEGFEDVRAQVIGKRLAGDFLDHHAQQVGVGIAVAETLARRELERLAGEIADYLLMCLVQLRVGREFRQRGVVRNSRGVIQQVTQRHLARRSAVVA